MGQVGQVGVVGVAGSSSNHSQLAWAGGSFEVALLAEDFTGFWGSQGFQCRRQHLASNSHKP